ncbi:MAG: DNA cytosine methyltransferase [Anaerolineales bacterium]|nr:DNA cytosine methyltransferase [Anaerolineales bacterium]
MSKMRPRLSKIINYSKYLEDCWQEHLTEKPDGAPTVVSTFAGCGGSSLGYSMAGFREMLAVEWDKNAAETFSVNFPDVPIFHGDITNLSVNDILRIVNIEPGELDVFDGSPPCQGFSTSGRRQLDDPRNQLFRQFTRLLQGLQPKVFVMENVSGMVKGKMKLIFAEIIRELRGCGYQVSARLLDARYFGVPQGRQRMIFIGVRKDLKIPPSHPLAMTIPTTAGEAIGDLPTDDLCMLGKPELLEMWKQCQPGKSFSSVHPKGSYFNTQKAHPFKVFPTVTKTTLGKSGAGICHWEKPGLLSIPMLKRAGSFPADFQFIGDFKDQWARIGNSVPPLLMRSIAFHIKEHILDKVN